MITLLVIVAFSLASIPLLRLILGIVNHFSPESLHPDAFRFMAWAERLFLITISAVFLGIIVPGFVFSLGMARAFGPTPHAGLLLLLLFPICLYALAAFVLNCPGVPLSWSIRLFCPVQCFLLPLLGMVPMGGASLIPPFLFCALLWFITLRDRIASAP